VTYGERFDRERGVRDHSPYRPQGTGDGAAGGSRASRDWADEGGAPLNRPAQGRAVPGRASQGWQPRRPEPEDEDEPESLGGRLRRRRQHMPLWQELPLLLIVAFCLAVLIRTFLLQAFFIPSGSMQDTLLIGDRVLVNKVVYDVRDPHRGEVVVFRGTDRWAPEPGTAAAPTGFAGKLGQTVGDLVGISRPDEKDFIKRVIGLPGDHVACCDQQGRVTVNGHALDEPYVVRNSPLELPPSTSECRSRQFAEVVIPPGHLWVMGDHRAVSQDSRCQGPVPIQNVIGRAFIIVWPSSRWDSLPVPDTFAKVPAAPANGAAPVAPPVVAPGSERAAPAAPGQPVATAPPTGSGGFIVILPALLTFPFAARSGLRSPVRRRRLSA
jgi:signal peptidase I